MDLTENNVHNCFIWEIALKLAVAFLLELEK